MRQESQSAASSAVSLLRWSWDGFGVALAGTVATLLLCFMVATPICTLGIPFLPDINTGSLVRFTPDDLHVIIDSRGEAYVSNETDRYETFAEAIESPAASGRYRTLVIDADRRVHYRALTPLLRAAQRRHMSVRFVGRETSFLEQSARESAAHHDLR